MVILFNKWLLLVSIPVIFGTALRPVNFLFEKHGSEYLIHPFHVSVVEINHNATDKTLEISCKIFTDDFEDALSKKFNAKIDLINPKDRSAMDKFVSSYIHENLQLRADGKPVTANYLGYEIDNEAAYAYLQVDNISSVKKIDIINSIMYDVFTDQVEINHVVVGGNRKSVKLNYPEKMASVQF